MVLLFGFPAIAQADNGKEFLNSIVEELLATNSVQYRHGQPYKPSTQGCVEKSNGTLQTRLAAAMLDANTQDWESVLHEANYAYNLTWHSTIKEMPFRVMLGHFPQDEHDVRTQREHEQDTTMDAVHDDVNDDNCDGVPVPASFSCSSSSFCGQGQGRFGLNRAS